MRHISDIAEQTKIPLCNLKWYGAFHDTTHHPHIHLIVYSTNPKQGFLTKQGIDKIRSVFANDIFHDDLQSIYQEQTLRCDELKMESKKYVEELVEKLKSGDFQNPELENLVQTLKVQLERTSGKKVYGYLKPEVKKTVDAIFKLISQDKNISTLYEKWCELERQKYKTYTQKEKEFPQLWENKVFRPVRNMIVRQVVEMSTPEIIQQQVEEQSNASPENAVMANTVMHLFANLSRCIADDYNQKFNSVRMSVDRKLRRMMLEKKQALGLKEEHIQEPHQY